MPDSLALSDTELARYARQILLDDWDSEAQENLKNNHVLIVGMGGLGCPVAETLVRAGVGSLTLIDDDTIDESNLQRQTLFVPADIGQSKVLTAKKRLETINALVKVEAINQRFILAWGKRYLQNLLQDSLNSKAWQLILDCSDNFATRDSLNQLSVQYKIALLSASAIGYEGQLALFEPNKNTGCYHCLFQHNAGEETERRCIDTGVLASTTAIMGNLQANAGLFFLGKNSNTLTQTLLLWQGKSMNLRKIRYQADPDCAVCGTHLSVAEHEGFKS